MIESVASDLDRVKTQYGQIIIFSGLVLDFAIGGQHVRLLILQKKRSQFMELSLLRSQFKNKRLQKVADIPGRLE